MHDILQAKAEADSHSASDDCEGSQIQADDLKGDVKSQSDECITANPGNGELEGGFEPGSLQRSANYIAAQNPFDRQYQREKYNQFEKAGDGQVAVSKFEKPVVKDFLERVNHSSHRVSVSRRFANAY